MIERSRTELLADVEMVRRRTRFDLSRLWFPMILFGLLTLVSATRAETLLAMIYGVVLLGTGLVYRRLRRAARAGI